MGDKRYGNKGLWSPVGYFASVLAIIFLAEAGVMYLLPFLLPPDIDVNIEAFCDAAILTVFSAPLLWWLLIRPLRELAGAESRKYARLINDAHDSIIVVDQNGRIELINPSAERLLGVRHTEAKQCLLSTLLPSVCFDESNENSSVRIAAAHRKTLNAELVAKDGSQIPVEYTLSTLHQSDRSFHTLILRDVSERQFVEEQKLKVQRARIESAHIAGKAEIATSVLHNVGNTLTSINVLTQNLLEDCRSSRAGGIAKVVKLLQDHQDDLGSFLTADTRGKQLPSYLASLSEHLIAEQNDNVSRLEMLRDHVGHANRIVAAQQAFARSPGIEEPTDLSELIENAIEIAKASLDRHGVAITKDLDPLPSIVIDRHKLIQVVVNLLTNAKDAVKVRPVEERMIHVSLKMAGDDRLHLSVKDNGMGIAPSDLHKIFAQGFTTKSDGHGFGLHFCANAVTEMNGRLSANSSGMGQGAEFKLDLPMKMEFEEVQA